MPDVVLTAARSVFFAKNENAVLGNPPGQGGPGYATAGGNETEGAPS
jgi:hypothetical protein